MRRPASTASVCLHNVEVPATPMPAPFLRPVAASLPDLGVLRFLCSLDETVHGRVVLPLGLTDPLASTVTEASSAPQVR
jgi:hypothetical protein